MAVLHPLRTVTALRNPIDEGLSRSDLDFRTIFEQYGRYVWRVLRRLGVPEADVPDVAQEVFMILRRKLGQVHSVVALRGFIYGIAVREASDYRRSARARYEKLGHEVREVQVDPPQEVELEQARARALLHVALARLDDDKRAVFVLYELEELGMREVAAAVGCPLQTAYSRLHAAREAITAAFEWAPRSRP